MIHFRSMPALVDSFRRFIQNIATFSNVVEIYVSRLTRRPVAILKTRSGCQFYVENANNNLGTVVEVFTLREYRDLDKVKERAQPTIVDIGANIGTFTIWAMFKYPRARVVAFEPEPTNATLLAKNVVLNGAASQVTVVEKAVCGSAGVRSLSVAGASSGKNSLAVDIGSNNITKVTCTTLDAIFDAHSIERCHCLKIDCEGAEYELLYAASDDILSRIDLILLEWHHVPGQSVEDLIKHLEASGFTITRSAYYTTILTAERL